VILVSEKQKYFCREGWTAGANQSTRPAVPLAARRHCAERTRRSNPVRGDNLDCFAEPVIGPRLARTRWLAMTNSYVIPGHREARSFDVQLHIRESITTSRGYGFRACAKRRIPE
jgi:hypothetical protein